MILSERDGGTAMLTIRIPLVVVLGMLWVPLGGATAAEPVTCEPIATLGIRDLGTLGGANSVANAVNTGGQVVGGSELAGGREHAFSWRDGGMTDLGALGGEAGTSVAFDVNRRGEIVGYSALPGGPTQAVRWTRGRIVELEGLGGSSVATAISDRGEVVGFSETPGGVTRPVRWTGRGRPIELDTRSLGDVGQVEARAVNDRGEIVGNVYQPSGEGIPVLWRHGRVTPLDRPIGETQAFASDINDEGQVAGWLGSPTPGDARAVIWDGDSLVELGVPGALISLARAINDCGDVVGDAQIEFSQQAILWEDGIARSLGSLVPGLPSGAFDIAESGEAVGFAVVDNQFHTHAVIWS